MSRIMKNLSIDQERLIMLLIAGKTQIEAAKELDVNIKTIQRWLALPHVDQAYREVRENLSLYVQARIKSLATKAIQALDASLTCDAFPAVRLKASQIVIERLVPVQAQAEQPSAEQAVDASLLGYMTIDEIETIERIVALATDRKRAAEEKIIPIRRA